METKFQKQVAEIENICVENMDCHVVLCKKGKEGATSIKGRLMDEIILLHEAINVLREDMNNHFPKPITEMLLSYITHDDGEEAKPDEPKGIPEWLKKLMNIEDSEDDEEENDDSEEEGTVSDDNTEQDALQKAVDGLAKALRDATGADNVDVICGHVGRRKDRG